MLPYFRAFQPQSGIADAIINPYRVGERESLRNHMLNLLPNDLLLLDRGYPAYWIFNLILSQGGNFCARISKQWRIVQDFIDLGTQETFIELHASHQSKKECIDREHYLFLTKKNRSIASL